jgi:hypothetical protein
MCTHRECWIRLAQAVRLGWLDRSEAFRLLPWLSNQGELGVCRAVVCGVDYGVDLVLGYRS